jgi:flagellar FliL protein
MAKDAQPPEKGPQQAAAQPAAASGFSMKKMLIIGLPLFVVQLGLVYFLLVKFVAPSNSPAGESSSPAETAEGKAAGEGVEQPLQKIFLIKDLIVNPAGTNGTRFLLTTIGFEVSTGEGLRELETKDIQVRDVLNTILTAKGLNDLVDVGQRDELRAEISEKVGGMLRSGSLTNVYFSKFIIQ